MQGTIIKRLFLPALLGLAAALAPDPTATSRRVLLSRALAASSGTLLAAGAPPSALAADNYFDIQHSYAPSRALLFDTLAGSFLPPRPIDHISGALSQREDGGGP